MGMGEKALVSGLTKFAFGNKGASLSSSNVKCI